MGPHVLGLVGDAEGKIGIAELGIARGPSVAQDVSTSLDMSGVG